MNKLSLEKRTQLITLLVEGNSVRACSRITGVAFNTVLKLVADVGKVCQQFHDEKVRGLNSKRIECDEIWSFVYAKNKNAHKTDNPEAGDAWTWTALDSDSRMIVSYYIGKRNAESGNTFMKDVASRLNNRVQLTSDGFKAYLEAVEGAFENDIDYAKVEKIYGKGETFEGKLDGRKRYLGSDRIVMCGNPDKKKISTSLVERQNLTMRTNIKRFTRKTNAFSKKLENHGHAQALYFVYYNFVRIHKTLRVTPAMQAGLMDRWMEIEDIAQLMDGNSK